METTYSSTKEILLAAPVSEESRTYKPVSHSKLIDLTLEGIEKAGFKLDKEYYTSARDGQVANAKYTISNVSDSEMQLQIGWQNSYDKSLSLKFAIGTYVFICGNGCVSGDLGSFKKKHVGDVQSFAPSSITEYINSAGDTFEQLQKDREVMKSIIIDRRIQAELVGRMMIEEEFSQSTQLNIINREFKNPTHDYNAPDSLWELYQYTTFSMKSLHPSLWMDSHIKASLFFNEAASGLYVPDTKFSYNENVEYFGH